MTQVMNYGVRPSLARRINFRMLAIVAIFGVIVGAPVYSFVKASLNHGVERVGNGFAVDLKALGSFPFDERAGTLTQVPKDYQKLDGKQVTLEGFMYTGQSAADQVNNFQLVYNVSKCCFGGPPKVQERVFAVVPNHQAVYNPGMYTMVRVTGKMHVAIIKDDQGTISSVYKLDVAGLEPV